MSEQEKDTKQYFPFFQLKGTHREIGKQYGESCKALIHKHLDSVKENLQVGSKVPLEFIEEKALMYQPYVQKHASFLDEEIQGMAEGANISLGEAYLLQVRAEMNKHVKAYNECTTFAISSKATKNGQALAGQNVDLPSFYSEIGVVTEIIPDSGAKVLMFAPAGQVSHIGINTDGMAVFANAITSDGWGEGLPRYMFSRVALACETVDEAVQKLRNIKRSSARNIIMVDRTDNLLNYENTPGKDAVIEPANGMLAHTNHYIAQSLLDEERAPASYLQNSQVRLERMNSLLADHYGEIDVEKIKGFFRDRENFPNCICRMPGDDEMQDVSKQEQDSITCASAIGIPSEGKLLVAIGPPNQYEYKTYRFSE